jgi:serine/arginine repetitive matrix protein 2
VNGLRDDDMDSVYPSRASFASEYSGQEGNESVQVRFKQHGRSGSTGSSTSFAPSSKKLYPGNVRPETKVDTSA